MNNRRKFLKSSVVTVAAASVVTINKQVLAQTEKLSETDPTAIALGYKEDTTKVDKAKYATHTSEQVCTGCALYQGDDVNWGGCGAFPGKLVAGKGWCQAFAAKG